NVVGQALLEKATAIDPSYGQALGVLATSQTFSAHMGWEDMATVTPVAERAALAAILADSEDPWAHHALGCVYLFTRRFDDSLAEFELALRLNPNFSMAQGYYGLALSYSGRWEEAIVAAHRDVAGAALHELRRAQPNISLAWIASQMPIRHEADRKHYLEGFRRAGL